jgi:serine/threonine-protein kinase
MSNSPEVIAQRYELGPLLGRGGMGRVHAATDLRLGRDVAIKVLRDDLAAPPDAAERFIREARAVNQIDHENVIDVFAFGRLEDGRLYLVMDLVEGRSLRVFMRPTGLARAQRKPGFHEHRNAARAGRLTRLEDEAYRAERAELHRV